MSSGLPSRANSISLDKGELFNKHHHQLPRSLTNLTAGMMECHQCNAKQGVDLKRAVDG